MEQPITRAEAIMALAVACYAGLEGDTNSYYLTSAPAEVQEDGTVIFMVGYAAEDPEESDPEGDPTVFMRAEDGTVQLDAQF